MADFTINQALVRARDIFAAARDDTVNVLTQAERSQADANVVALNDILGRLAGGNILPQNRRNAAFNTIQERLNASSVVQNAHVETLPSPSWYNGMDLMWLCAEPLRDGVAEIISADG